MKKWRWISLSVLILSGFAPASDLPPLCVTPGAHWVIAHGNGRESERNFEVYWEYDVLRVFDSAGRTNSDVRVVAKRPDGSFFNSTTYYYACDSAAFYVDLRNRSWSSKAPDYMHSGSLLAYPRGMKTGDSLRGGNYSWRSNGTTMQAKIYNRYVAGIDTLEISGAKIATFKITNEVYFQSLYPDKQDAPYANINKETEWFSPAFGVIRQEVRMQNGMFRDMWQLRSFSTGDTTRSSK